MRSPRFGRLLTGGTRPRCASAPELHRSEQLAVLEELVPQDPQLDLLNPPCSIMLPSSSEG